MSDTINWNLKYAIQMHVLVHVEEAHIEPSRVVLKL